MPSGRTDHSWWVTRDVNSIPRLNALDRTTRSCADRPSSCGSGKPDARLDGRASMVCNTAVNLCEAFPWTGSPIKDVLRGTCGRGPLFFGSRGSLKSFPTDLKACVVFESITELRLFEPYANARECRDDMIPFGCRAPLANAEWPVESISANRTTST